MTVQSGGRGGRCCCCAASHTSLKTTLESLQREQTSANSFSSSLYSAADTTLSASRLGEEGTRGEGGDKREEGRKEEEGEEGRRG